MRFTSAAVAVCLCLTGIVAAQDAAAIARRSTNIPAQGLGPALQALARERGFQVVYLSDSVESRQSAGAKGELTTDEALKRILDGTGMAFRYLDDNTVTIYRVGDLTQDGQSAPAQTGLLVTTGEDGGGSPATPERKTKSVPSLNSAQAEQSEQSGGSLAETASNPVVVSADGQLTEFEDPVVVTGSRIAKREQGALEVRVYDRETLDKSGTTSVGEFLNTLPEVSVQVTGTGYQTFGGSSTVQLRGLPTGTTLTLINGRRVEASGMLTAFGFFDLNNLPMAIVEQIQVVPAGSAAVYGGDALAGVVNIILKKNMDGLETNLGYVTTTEGGGDGINANVGWGTGNDRGSISLVASYRDQDGLLGSERSITANADYTRFEGGVDFRALYCNPANVVSLDGNPLPGLNSTIAGAPQSDTGIVAVADFADGQPHRCSDNNSRSSLNPDAEQVALFASGSLQLGSAAELYAELLHSENRQETARSGMRLQGGATFTDFVLSAGNPYNPFGADVGVTFRDSRPDSNKSSTDFDRFLLGARGDFTDTWGWEMTAWTSRDKSHIHGRIENDAEIAARLASTDPAFAFNPFDTSGPSDDVYELMYRPRNQRYGAHADSLNALVRGAMPLLSAGPMQLVVGAEATNGELDDFDDDAFSTLPPQTKREVRSIFAEARVPLIQGANRGLGSELLAVSLAGRYDDYDDFGSETTPQYGVEFRPTNAWLIRGSYSESFKPPSLFALSNPVFTFPFPFIDPQRDNETVFATASFGGNPELNPESGRFHSFGFVFGPDLPSRPYLGMTYWDVTLDDRIGFLFQEIVTFEDMFPGRVTRAQNCPGDPIAPPCPITDVDITQINFGKFDSSGIDLQADASYGAGSWTVRPSIALTRTLDYKTALTPGAPQRNALGHAFTDGFSPKWKGTLALELARGGFSTQVSERYVGEYVDYDFFGSLPTTRTIGDDWYTDLVARWEVERIFGGSSSPSGYVQLSVINLFDRAPQFSTYSSIGYDPTQYDIRGRVVSLTAGAHW